MRGLAIVLFDLPAEPTVSLWVLFTGILWVMEISRYFFPPGTQRSMNFLDDSAGYIGGRNLTFYFKLIQIYVN